MPGPLIEKLWQVHRDDAHAYATFTTALGTGKLTHHRSRHSHTGDPAWEKTRARYRAAFGDIPARYWPGRWRVWLDHNPLLLTGTALYAVYGLLYLNTPNSPHHASDSVARILLSVITTAYCYFEFRKQSPQGRMTAPRASYAQSPKAPTP